jgi:hypothetical protein
VLGGYIYIYLCLYDFSIRFWKDTESMFDVAKLKSSTFCGLNHNPVLSSKPPDKKNITPSGIA